MTTTYRLIDTAADADVTDASFDAHNKALTSGGGAQAAFRNTVAGPTAPLTLQKSGGSLLIAWYTPLLSAITISGTISFSIVASETNMSANATLVANVDRCDASGTLIDSIISSTLGTELPTTEAAQTWTGTPTSRTLADGQRLRLWLQIDDAGTMGSGFQANVSGLTVSTMQFTENIVDYVQPPVRSALVVPSQAALQASSW